jgi:hypothetical protein
MKTWKELVIDAINMHRSEGVSRHEASRRVTEGTEHSSENIRKSMSRYEKKMDHAALDVESTAMGFPLDNVSSYWLKSKHISVHVKGDTQTTDYFAEIEKIVSDYSPDTIREIPKIDIPTPKALKVTLSDMHVGLEPNPDNNSLFSYEYNAEVFKSNLDKVYNSILKEYNTNGRFDLLIILDLGDGLDGWDGLTTRGGHKLEQNMSNQEAFKTFVEGKLMLIENCIKGGIANEVLVANVCNDNHSGSFASIANMTIKMLLNRTYGDDSIKFHILERFMEHIEYGVHTYILTHGKDSKHMFKGLPLELNDKAITFINDYIDHYEIKTPYIHVEKGDLHRIGYSRTKKFDYRNYMSFAPPSTWVQHNFGSGYSGYSLDVIPKLSGEISHTDYFFDLSKKL